MRPPARYALAIAAAALAGFALAQNGAGFETPSGAHPLLLVIIGGAVAYLRSTPVFERIDGPATVPLFAMIVGAIVGAGGELVGALDFETTAVLGRPWAGMAGGILAAIETVFGVSLIRYFGKVLKRTDDGKLTVDVPAAIEAGRDALGAKPAGPVANAVAFLLDTAERLLGQPPTGAALVALYPLILKYAQAPEILTDDARAQIQAEVLGALSRAGLIGQDLI
jgi:hypothetical protein